MILHDLPAGTTLFRALTPQWASQPTSGAGAALRGGRFNREGVHALYLSLDEVTALREYQQTSAFLPPCTMCSYTVALRGLVNLRQLHSAGPWDELWQDWCEDWRHLRFELHIEPPTWVLADLGPRRHGAGPWLPWRPLSKSSARGRHQSRGVSGPASGRQLGRGE